MKSKVKVDRVELLAAMRARRKKIIEEYKRSVEQHTAEMQWQSPKIAAALHAAANAAAEGRFPEVGSRWRERGCTLEVAVPFKVPVRPTGGPNTYQIDRAVKVLEMSREDTIAISADDYGAYLS